MGDDVGEPVSHDGSARVVRALDLSLGVVLSILVFFMMCLTFVDVSGRQAFDAPVPGGYEMTQMAMGLVVYIGLPVVCARREHITIGLLDYLFRGTVKRVQQTTINLLLGAMTVVWAYEVWLQAGKLAASGEILMYLRLPVAPVVYVMAVLTLVAAFFLFLMAWLVARGKAPPSPQLGLQ